nr:MAG TPA: hypothetical protein [Caudoviricetes sp.]
MVQPGKLRRNKNAHIKQNFQYSLFGRGSDSCVPFQIHQQIRDSVIRVQGQYLRPIQCRRDNRRYYGVIIPTFECFSKQRCYDGHSEV